MNRIDGLGSGSDFAPILQGAGITALDTGYHYDIVSTTSYITILSWLILGTRSVGFFFFKSTVSSESSYAQFTIESGTRAAAMNNNC